MRVQDATVGVGLGAGMAVALVGVWAWKRFLLTPHTWEEVGEVSDLIIYPVKSARGIQLKGAQATSHGLASNLLEDRSFMVINDQGTFITSRQVGTLATVVTQMSDHTLTLKAKGFEDISVDLQRDLNQQLVLETKFRGLSLPGVDCGDEVAKWLTEVLYRGEVKVRLVYKGNVLKHRQAVTPHYYDFTQYRKKDRLFYADEGSFMLASQSSLDDLNSRLSKPVKMGNFRPNIVVKGSAAFDEDDWAYVKIGGVTLRRLKPCERCILVTVDPITGERHPEMEPITTLKGYRLLKDPPKLAKRWSTSPIFGVTMSIDETGPITIGEKVFVARASVHPHFKGF